MTTHKKVFGPKIPPNFILWGGRTINATEQHELSNKLINDNPLKNPYAIDIAFCKKKEAYFYKLMTDTYGPRNSSRDDGSKP